MRLSLNNERPFLASKRRLMRSGTALQDLKDAGVPGYIIDNHIRTYGVRALSPFIEFLDYWDPSRDHLVDYMHTQKNNWQRCAEMLVGQDWDQGTAQAMSEMEMHDNLTREEDPETPHWPFPEETAKKATEWVTDTLPLPRNFCSNDYPLLFKGERCHITKIKAVMRNHLERRPNT